MRRRRRSSRLAIPVIALIIIVVAGWWFWPRGEAEPAAQAYSAGARANRIEPAEPQDTSVPEATIAMDTSVSEPADEVLAPVGSGTQVAGGPAHVDRTGPASGAENATAPEAQSDSPTAQAGDKPASPESYPRIQASLQRYQAGEKIAARTELNRMLVISRNAGEQAELRRQLTRIANETVFAREPQPDDPLTATYTIKSGDVLLNIGKQFDVPHEIIMRINGIEDPRRIRAGQRLKVPRGPFHVKIHMSAFRLDVYLQHLYVRSYPVGLGVDRSTPAGKWVVKDRLKNPTYYPPASASEKRIIPPDDPTNPLGEYWIDLEGIEGDAVGCDGYGIHGTIEPDSIGRAVSHGCIRMHNQDVEFLYGLMMRGRSTVTTLP
jgi:LysM repeat protein